MHREHQPKNSEVFMGFRIVVLVVLLSVFASGCGRVDKAKEALDKAKALKSEAQKQIEDVAEKARRVSSEPPQSGQEKEDQ
jgi:hypothetical protein